MNVTARAFGWILSLLLVLSCSKKSERSEHSFQIYVENGVTIAETTGGPMYEGELFEYEQLLTLKQDPNQPESLLNMPEALTMDDRGFFYVQDFGNSRIAVFDSTGRYTHSIGRPGDGPGEFRAVWITDLQGDVLTLYDYRLRRTTLYRTDGTLSDVFTFPRAISMAMHQYRTPEGYLVIVSVPYEVKDNIRYSRARFLTLTADLDTVGMAETSLVPTEYQSTFFVMNLEQPYWNSIPFVSDPQAIYIADMGMLLSTGIEPVLWWYDLDGTLHRKVSLDLPKTSVTEEDKAANIARLDKMIEEAEGPRKESLKSTRANLIFPEAKAYWSLVSVDDSEYIWLRIPESREEREQTGGGYSYHVLSPDGEYLGVTRSPAAGRVVRGHLLDIMTDPETDEEVPTVWRLIPQPEGFRYPG